MAAPEKACRKTRATRVCKRETYIEYHANENISPARPTFVKLQTSTHNEKIFRWPKENDYLQKGEKAVDRQLLNFDGRSHGQ